MHVAILSLQQWTQSRAIKDNQHTFYVRFLSANCLQYECGMVRSTVPSVKEHTHLVGSLLPPHLPCWNQQWMAHTPPAQSAQRKTRSKCLVPEAVNELWKSEQKTNKKKLSKEKIMPFLEFSDTFQNSLSPFSRIIVVNSSRRTIMVHLLKLYWSTSLGLNWEVLSPRGKQLSAAASSWVANSVRKKLIAFRKLDFSLEPLVNNKGRVYYIKSIIHWNHCRANAMLNDIKSYKEQME